MRLFAEMGLRTRLVTLVVGSLIAVILVMSAVSIYTERTNLQDAMNSKNAVMQDALKRKGVALVRNVALASSRAIAVSNFSFLVEVINSAVENDGEVVYGILMDTNRRAMVHSVAGLSNSTLDAPVDVKAAETTTVMSQDATFAGQQVLEVVAPIYLENERWGVVRFGLSLKNLTQEIQQTREMAQKKIEHGVLLSLLLASLLTAFGSAAGATVASRLLNPLRGLMEGVHKIRQGDMQSSVVVVGSPELVSLGSAFNEMTYAVKQRESALQAALTAAEQANRLKSEFLANVSHELRTPLNAIINVPSALVRDYQTHLLWHCDKCSQDFEPDSDTKASTEDLQENCPDCGSAMTLSTRAFFQGDASTHYKFLQRSIQSAQHLLSVVTDILDFSKLDAGKMTLKQSSITVRPLLEEVRETVSVLAEAKSITLTLQNAATVPEVYADPVKLSQVIINLISNAVKFTPKGGTITVSVEPDAAGMARFTVSDTGIGIPKDKLEVIFESFRQVDGSHTRSHNGTGLGLTISRKLVELHGGKIWAESELSRGSRFIFTMPLHSPDANAAEAASQLVATNKAYTGKVLVIDDDRPYLELAVQILSQAGFDVHTLSDSTAASSVLSTKNFDVVLLDIMMPDVSGLSVLKSLRADPSTMHLPVVISTAYHSNKELAERMGAVWLPKPWTAESLLSCVSKTIGKSHQYGLGDKAAEKTS